MEDTGEDSDTDLQIDWSDPAIAEYYYNLYCSHPEIYQMMLITNRDDPSLVAARNYAESRQLLPILDEIDYRAEKEQIAQKWAGRWDEVAQLGLDPAYISQVKESWDTLDDFGKEIIPIAGSRASDWVVQHGGPEEVAHSVEVLEVLGLSVQKDTARGGAYAFYLLPYGLALYWKTSLQCSLLVGLELDLAHLEQKYEHNENSAK